MRTFLKRLHLAGLVSATLFSHACEWLGSFFVSRAERDRRASERRADLDQDEQEWERLDRLRNPSDYRGK